LLARSGLLRGGGQQPAYSVEPYTLQQHLISARERVLAHAEPDESSPTVVMFGAGASLDVVGRVSRGIGADWYQIRWNNQIAYIRQQDAVAGEEAPPSIAERPKPEEEEMPAEPEEPQGPDVAEFPPLPPAAGLELSDVRWARAPNARDFARFYPHRALEQGRSGRVVLDCVAAASGALDCSVAEENPVGWGFGDAAISIARQARIEPTTPDGRSVAGAHVRVPLAFRAD
jgi:TonB family protein